MKTKTQNFMLISANIGLFVLALVQIHHIATYKSSVRQIIQEELATREHRFVERYADQVTAFMSDIGVEGTKPSNAEEMLQAYLTVVLGG